MNGPSFWCVAFVPLIPLVAPPSMLRESPLSVFFVISLPVALAVASWFYLNWIFHGDARTFLTVSDSSFLGELLHSGESPWLVNFGGSWVAPTLTALLLAIAAFPGMIWQAVVVWRSPRLRRGVLSFFLVPVLAVGVSTSSYFIGHPVEMLFLLNAGCHGRSAVAAPRNSAAKDPGGRFPAARGSGRRPAVLLVSLPGHAAMAPGVDRAGAGCGL